MGWDFCHAHHYDAKGRVDRKKECESVLNWDSETQKNEVVKSALKGSVYYAAVRRTYKSTGVSEIAGVVILTKVDSKDYYNFGYKLMSESMGPFEDDCPVSIVNLLSPTDDAYAIEWRERVRGNKKNKKSLSSLPIGSVIEWETGGITHKAIKMAPAYQFKTAWFKDFDTNTYWKKKHIPDNWAVVA